MLVVIDRLTLHMKIPSENSQTNENSQMDHNIIQILNNYSRVKHEN